jgi:adenine-specific DNA-methyltransferase
MAIEYLGHKESQLEFLLGPIDSVTQGRPHRVADIFCGTASVSVALKERGHSVLANDSLAMCATFAQAALLNDEEPSFHGILNSMPRNAIESRYRQVLRFLELLPPREGFVTRNYSPRSLENCGQERRYFSVENALKIDAIRAQINEWGACLLPKERALLLTDLVRAANAVSNIAGTYGCYLKHWKTRALTKLRLTPARFAQGGKDHDVTCMDSAVLAPNLSADIVYADPPYTKRQYSAYYHVPETIILDDDPVLDGSTGLRPWREKGSAWCYRRHAPETLSKLMDSLSCEWFLLSYSEDGQISHAEIMDILAKHGKLSVREKEGRRYKSANRAHKGAAVTDRLYILRRSG